MESIHDHPPHPTSEPQVKTPDKLELAYAMQRRGTAFARALANLIILADEHEIERIKAAWPLLWERYADLAVEIFKKD